MPDTIVEVAVGGQVVASTAGASIIGRTGPTGPIGPSGPQGIQGEIGPSGPQGAQSIVPGPSGPQGVEGVRGIDGQAGVSGPKGEAGPSGPQGADSTVVGPSGPQGSVGPSGPHGGPQGEIGPSGPQGIQGIQGEIGPSGPQGADSTVVGPSGPQGTQGSVGPSGPQGADSTVVGPSGPQGEIGVSGPQGIQGAQGFAGPSGPQGEIGVSGPQGGIGVSGPQGIQGEVGPSGPRGIVGLEGSRGPSGPQGADSTVVGPSGPQGADSTVVGPSGPQGEIGVSGPQGEVGFPGFKYDARRVFANQYISGEIIEYNGNYFICLASNDAILPEGQAIGVYWSPYSFVGSQGVQGVAGPSGPQGAQGEVGPSGPQGADSTVVGPSGPQGAQGEVGPSGPQGADSTVVGPSGPQGVQGSVGPSGPQGIQGIQGSNFNYSVAMDLQLLSSNQGYIVNTDSGIVTVTLPASPAPGDFINFTFNRGNNNNLTIINNGKRINSLNEHLICDISGTFSLIYTDETIGWKFVPYSGITTPTLKVFKALWNGPYEAPRDNLGSGSRIPYNAVSINTDSATFGSISEPGNKLLTSIHLKTTGIYKIESNLHLYDQADGRDLYVQVWTYDGTNGDVLRTVINDFNSGINFQAPKDLMISGMTTLAINTPNTYLYLRVTHNFPSSGPYPSDVDSIDNSTAKAVTEITVTKIS